MMGPRRVLAAVAGTFAARGHRLGIHLWRAAGMCRWPRPPRDGVARHCPRGAGAKVPMV